MVRRQLVLLVLLVCRASAFQRLPPEGTDRNPLLPQCAGSHPEGIYGSWFKEPHDQLHDLHNFTTCAIVGGGKSDNEWGADIDTNSAVFRFNDAPSRGFESLVGSKTTMRIQNRQYCGYAEKSEWCVYYSKSSKEDKGKNVVCNQQMQAGHTKAGGKCVHPPLSNGGRCVELDPNPGALDFGSNYWKQFPKPQSTTGNSSLAPRLVCTTQQTAMKRAIEGIEERAKRQKGKAAGPASSKSKLARPGRALLSLVAAKPTKTTRVRMVRSPRKSHQTARKASAKPTTSELLAMGGKSLRENGRVLRKAVKSGEIKIPVCAPAKVSAGFYGVLLATQLCAEVNLFLFTGTASHYYVKSRGDHGSTLDFADRHDWVGEQMCMHALDQLPHVHFHDAKQQVRAIPAHHAARIADAQQGAQQDEEEQEGILDALAAVVETEGD